MPFGSLKPLKAMQPPAAAEADGLSATRQSKSDLRISVGDLKRASENPNKPSGHGTMENGGTAPAMSEASVLAKVDPLYMALLYFR